MLGCFDVTTQMELLQGFKGSKTECLLRSKVKTYQSPGGAMRK